MVGLSIVKVMHGNLTRGGMPMTWYLVTIIASVFLGSRVVTLPSPWGPLGLYRLLVVGFWPLFIWRLHHRPDSYRLVSKSKATMMLVCYWIWWVIALVSGLWVESLRDWWRVFFLMSLGMTSITACYFIIDTYDRWILLCRTAWLALTGLVFWGYSEILTNHYLFADMVKLDKDQTFVTEPLTRIPITYFANQNDFATVLLAYLVLSLIVYYGARSLWLRFGIFIPAMASIYLLIRTESRMAIICLFALILCMCFRRISFKQTRPFLRIAGLLGMGVLLALVLFLPALQEKIASLLYDLGPSGNLSGDAKRLNIWRNGLIYWSQTVGMGVGTGNIERWVSQRMVWPTHEIRNMHNWWLEILVSNGTIAFVVYLFGYFNLLARLVELSRKLKDLRVADMAYILSVFLIIFIPASITSASNMLIEWHWVFFGLILAFVKWVDRELIIYDRAMKGKR